jgi:hypothetical protein
MMIQLLEYRLKCRCYVGVIHYPAHGGIAFAGNGDFHLKTMSMQSPAFVSIRDIGQKVSRLKLKCLSQIHLHINSEQKAQDGDSYKAITGKSIVRTPMSAQGDFRDINLMA